jgi:hypothetical protein
VEHVSEQLPPRLVGLALVGQVEHDGLHGEHGAKHGLGDEAGHHHAGHLREGAGQGERCERERDVRGRERARERGKKKRMI